MKFFFPDSVDQVDPSFNFETETRSPHRVRQRDDLYVYEVLSPPPLDGLLVSKAAVDGIGNVSGKFTLAQRHRLFRVGVREFYRLDRIKERKIETMGDCGAFSYVKEEKPPYSVDEVIDYYVDCGFDYGVAIDHVILGFDASLDSALPGIDVVPPDWRRRQELTLAMAKQFLRRHRARRCRFTPVAVAQGWSPESYAYSVDRLQAMGYQIIALGGLVPLKTFQIVDCLKAAVQIRKPDTHFHLFGVIRFESLESFAKLGVTSLDSTSPLRRAFKDKKNNYYTLDRTYQAIRVPQVAENVRVKRMIQKGEVDQHEAVTLATKCMRLLTDYDSGKAKVKETVKALSEYCTLIKEEDKSKIYSEVLTDKPWRNCSCNICREIGIHVIIFRGAERNRRRGFHNLYVTYQRLQLKLASIKE